MSSTLYDYVPLNLKLVRGDTELVGKPSQTYYEDETTNNPKDFTGSSFKLQVRSEVDSALIFEMSTAGGELINGGTSGTITYSTIDQVTSQALPVGKYKTDLQWTKTTGDIETLGRGDFTIVGDITEV